MKAVVFADTRSVMVDEVAHAVVEEPTNVVVRVTSSAICGTDLHTYDGRTGATAGGLAAAGSSGELAVHTAPAFAGYVTGAALGTWIVGPPRAREQTWPVVVTLTLVVELAVIGVFSAGRGAPGYPRECLMNCCLPRATSPSNMPTTGSKLIRAA
jgi:hypothetical protein